MTAERQSVRVHAPDACDKSERQSYCRHDREQFRGFPGFRGKEGNIRIAQRLHGFSLFLHCVPHVAVNAENVFKIRRQLFAPECLAYFREGVVDFLLWGEDPSYVNYSSPCYGNFQNHFSLAALKNLLFYTVNVVFDFFYFAEGYFNGFCDQSM